MNGEILLTTLAFLVVLALLFDFMNGFHDAANSIATVVSTGVLKPYQAVAWAAMFNFVAIGIFHLKVAATVGKGIVDPEFVDYHVIFGALIVFFLIVEPHGMLLRLTNTCHGTPAVSHARWNDWAVVAPVAYR